MAATHRESDVGLGLPADAPRPPASLADRPAEVLRPPEPGGDSLWARLWAQPQSFEFFAALRVFALAGMWPPGGASGPTGSLRFRVPPTLAFPPSDLCDLAPARDGPAQAELTVAFLGLIGPSGVLPHHYTALAHERLRKGDRALCDFLDIFHQRLITLFAAAGEKYRFDRTYAHAEQVAARCRAQGPQVWRSFLSTLRPEVDRFSQILLDLCGLGTPLLRLKDSVRAAPVRRTEVSDEVVRLFSGGLAQRHRNAGTLAQMITALLGLRVRIVPLVGQWITLPPEYQTCLGSAAAGLGGGLATGPAPPRLGQSTVVGSRIRELQGRFRIQLGPLKLESFLRLLPVGDQFRWLAHLVRLYVGPALDFEFQPVLEGSEVPWCQLGATGPAAPRLGWNTWIRCRPFDRPVDDAVFLVPDDVSMGQ
jgi:type VI secretion system protein ImpH